MRTTKTLLAIAVLGLATGAATAQSIRMDRDGGFSFKFGRDDRRGDVEGKRASCEVTHGSLLFRPRRPAASGAACEARHGWRTPSPTSSGADTCPAGRSPKNNVAARTSCSAASTSLATSMMMIAGVAAERRDLQRLARNQTNLPPFAMRQHALPMDAATLYTQSAVGRLLSVAIAPN